jgi:hypothetical protein
MKPLHLKIFQDPPDGLCETWRHGALVGGMAEGAYDRLSLADSYKMAGDVLVKECLDRGEAYELVYPIIFNYRHSLELYLKLATNASKKIHPLRDLVDELERYVRGKYGSDLPAWFKDRVLEFDDFDPGSTVFRYDDLGVEQRSTGDKGEFWVCLRNLRQIMADLQSALREVVKERRREGSVY